MSLELLREQVKVSQVIAEESTQTIVQNDIIVPDIKPDVARILLADGEAHIKSADVSQDKVTLNGSVYYKILYTSDDELRSVKSINTSCDFSCILETPGTKQGMNCLARLDVEHVDCEILNGRKVGVKSILSAKGKVTDESVLDVATDIAGAENVQILRGNITLNSYIGSSNEDFTVNESLEIPSGKPSIKELLRSDVKIINKDCKAADGKIVVRGDISISTLYLGDDEEQSIQFMEHEIPFAQALALDDLDENAECDVDIRLDSQQFEVGEDSDGEPRLLIADILLGVNASGTVRKTIETIEDAYSPNMRLSLEKKAFKIEDVVAENKNQVTLKETVSLGADNPEASEIFNVLCKPTITDYRIADDKVTIEGLVNANILYLSNNSEQPLFCCSQDIPFRHTAEIGNAAPTMSCAIDLDIEHCSYSMLSPDQMDLRIVVGIGTKVMDQIDIPLIARAVEAQQDERYNESRPSITLYFSQPGDTLWKVAKKYATTVEALKKVNSLGDEELMQPGQQILIMSK